MSLAASQLYRRIAKGILADAAVTAYCVANFKKALTVRIGRDGRNPLDQSICPLVTIVPYTDDLARATGTREIVPKIEVSVASEKMVDVAGIGEFENVRLSDELTRLVLAAVNAALDGTFLATESTVVTTDAISFFPVADASAECKLRGLRHLVDSVSLND